MDKVVAKIYKIDPVHFVKEGSQFLIKKILKAHNDKSDKQFVRVPCMLEVGEFFNLELFVYVPESNKKPSWFGLVNEITGSHQKLTPIESKYPSFLLFFYTKEEVFAICGGGGIWVIESYIDSQFGFKVVECLIDPNQSDLRTVSKRGLFGIELMSSTSFRANHVLTDEDSFGKYYKGLDVFIDRDKLKKIGITTNNSKLLVRGEIGFKIDNKVSFKEIENRIELIRLLLNKGSDIELNPFRQLDNRDLKVKIGETFFEDLLIRELIESYFEEFHECTEIYHPSLKEFLHCSRLKFKFPKLETVEIETWERFSIKLIFRKLGLDTDAPKIEQFLKNLNEIMTSIINPETGKSENIAPLIDWLHGEVVFKDKKYMKLEKNWCTYSENYKLNIDKRIDNLFLKDLMWEVPDWNAEFQNEGDYNECFGKGSNALIGDMVYHNRIELADVIEFGTNELIFYHFKIGFNKNIRVLADQIINSAKVIADFSLTDNETLLESYFNKIRLKGSESKDSAVNYDNFKKMIQENKIRFVFGLITKKKTDTVVGLLEELKSSRSTIAKMALLNFFYIIKQFDYKFSVAKVNRF